MLGSAILALQGLRSFLFGGKYSVNEHDIEKLQRYADIAELNYAIVTSLIKIHTHFQTGQNRRRKAV